MKLRLLIQLATKSAKRLFEADRNLEESGDRVWLLFMRKESGILLRLALKLWLKLRFRGIDKQNKL